jgi:hypothetical protein
LGYFSQNFGQNVCWDWWVQQTLHEGFVVIWLNVDHVEYGGAVLLVCFCCLAKGYFVYENKTQTLSISIKHRHTHLSID